LEASLALRYCRWGGGGRHKFYLSADL